MNYGHGFEIMASVIFIGYLLWVSWQDYREKMVVRYSHGLGLMAIVILLLLRRHAIAEQPLEYLIGVCIVLISQGVAYKCSFYGLADVLVFLMCGLYFLVQKGPHLYLTAYVMVLAVSGCALLLVQIFKGNVKRLHLRKAVAYIPYICFAFVLTKVVV